MLAKKAKHFYLYACIVLWLAISIDLLVWYSGQYTLSRVAATNGLSHIVDATGAIISALLTFIFLRKWFFKVLPINRLVHTLFYLALGCTVIISLLPASAGATLKAHAAFATILSFSLVAILLAYILDKSSIFSTRIYAFSSLIFMLLGLALTKGILRQIIGIFAFSGFILTSTYINKKKY